MDKPVENGVGISGVTDDLMPAIDRKLRRDYRRFAAIAFFEDFQKIMACCGVERLKTPVIENQQISPAKRAQNARMASVTARQGKMPFSWENAARVAVSPRAPDMLLK